MIRLLVSMVAAGAVAAAVDGNGTAKTLAFLVALLVLYGGPAFVRWLLAPSADAYGPCIDDDAAFSDYLARLRGSNRELAARFRALRNLRGKVAGAWESSNERTSEGRMAAAREQLAAILAEHRLAPWTRWRLRRRFARDEAAYDRAKYLRWALEHLERARSESTGTAATRERARRAALDVIERGLRDPSAEHEPLRALRREHGPPAEPPPAPTSTAVAPAPEDAATPPEERAAPLAVLGPVRWVAPGDAFVLGDWNLEDGMLWTGPGAASDEPSLIDPELDVQAPRTDRRNGPRGASYRDWTPTQRGAYLAWLAEGRRDADAPKAFPRLFLDGVERRLVVDAVSGSVARSELERLVRAVLDLAERQARRPTIAASARTLAEWATLRFGVELDGVAESRMTLAVALARAYAGGHAPTAGLAWAWARAVSGIDRVALRRAPAEVRAAFELAYAREPLRHDALRATGERLGARHEAHNASLGGRTVEIEDPLPAVDVDHLPARLSELLERACAELEPYARALGDSGSRRAPDLVTLATLPDEILAQSDAHALVGLRSQLSVALAAREVAFFEARELFAKLRGTKREALALARVCDALGHGFEPDVRFGAKPMKPGTRLAVFWAAEEAPTEPTPEVELARGILELAVSVCAADGEIDAVEHAHLVEWIDDELELRECDRPRMQAHFAGLIDRPPRRPRLRTDMIPAADRARIGRLLVRIATVQGTPDPATVRVLERVYEALGLEARSLHADLHVGGESLAAPEVRASSGFDRERLEAKRAETAAVASLLREVFEPADEASAPAQELVARAPEDAVEPEASAEPAAGSESPLGAPVNEPGPAPRLVAGLDAAHSAFALALAEHAELARADVEELAAELGLLADGALDVLNDRAFELYDAPFWEGDDPLEIDPDTAREMTT